MILQNLRFLYKKALNTQGSQRQHGKGPRRTEECTGLTVADARGRRRHRAGRRWENGQQSWRRDQEVEFHENEEL